MNRREQFIDLKEASALLDHRMVQNAKKNTLRPQASETASTTLTKAMICHELVKRGLDFYTEAIFKNGGRADIFVLPKRVAIEVMDSEKTLKATKAENYPCRILTIRAGVYTQLDELFNELERSP